MISQVKHVSIPVRDQKKALDFYTLKLGFKVVVNQEFDPNEQRWIELGIPGAQTRIVLFTPKAHEAWIGSMMNIVFSTEDIEKTYRELKEKGVEFIHEPKKESWGSYMTFQDLDGNQFMISTS